MTICGLFGGISSVLSQSETDYIFGLSAMSVFRGTDSSGLLVVTSKKGNSNQFENIVYRELFLAPELFNRVFDEGRVYNKKENSVRMIMGHARAATLGVVNRDNCHPFSFSNVTGCHNGTVPTVIPSDLTKEEAETNKANDSWNIYNLMNNEGLDVTLERIKHGAYALTWIDKKTDTLNFIRNDKRPLFFASNGGTLYWASEKEFLEYAGSRSRIVTPKIHEFEPHVHYSLPMNCNSGIRLSQVDKSSICKPKVYPSPSTNTPWSRKEWEEALEEFDTNKELSEKANVVEIKSPPPAATPSKPKSIARFVEIATTPNVSSLANVDYYMVVNNTGKNVGEFSQDEIDYIVKDNSCCNCGTCISCSQVPSAGFFSSNPEEAKQFYYVCGSCMGEGDNFFVSEEYASEVLQIKPIYIKVN